MSKQVIHPANSLTGSLRVPGDKSISHRYAILAALAEGTSEIRNYSPAGDCASTLGCLERLGISVERRDDLVGITGRGLSGLQRPRRDLDAGNSGTTMRLLAGVLSGQSFDSTLTGDDSLRRRPMRRVIDPLTQMGAKILARDNEFAPLKISGGRLSPIQYTLPLPSAQLKSAILLAGLYADGATSITEPVRTRDHSELALAEFGADVRVDGHTIRVDGHPRLDAQQLTVPGDLSSAVFFLAAVLIVPGAKLLVEQVGLNPTRTAVLDFLASMGAPISLVSVQMRHGELIGDIEIRHARLSGGSVTGSSTAAMIDELPMLAALAPYTEEGIEICDARELRVKESDRIAALADNLRRIGADVEEFADGLRVAGRFRDKLRGAEIDPRGDHRIAMAFAVAALGAQGDTTLRDAECAGVSFPQFYSLLESLVS